MEVTLEIPDEVLEIYKKYADNRGCTLEQALLAPITELASLFMQVSN